MKLTQTDYSLYLPPPPDVTGVQVTSAGYTLIKPGSHYPPGHHPIDHLLDWEQGRVLQDLQIVYISEGSGTFYSQAAGDHPVRPGTVFWLLPGMRHRYRPDIATGWVEHWVELHGQEVQQLLHTYEFQQRKCIVPLADPWLAECFVQLHTYAAALRDGAQEALNSLGLHILTHLLYVLHQPSASDAQTDHDIQAACARMMRQVHFPPCIADIADQLGMSQPTFRKEFRKRTGLSPKQYHLHLRIRKAQELLQNPALKLQQIADALGYHSTFHFSADFKKNTGISPSLWRAQLITRSISF